MMHARRFRLVLVLVLGLGFSGATVSAQCCGLDYAPTCSSNVPRSMFFIGAGAGWGILGSEKQSVYNKGIAHVFVDGDPVADGMADGPPVEPRLDAQSEFVPHLQFGYFQHFDCSDWLWGFKQTYTHLDLTSTEHRLVIPQFGSSTNPDITTFDGFSVTRSYEVTIDHQLTLVPFIGKSFQDGFVYAGAGPSLSRVGARVNEVVGFATINGDLLDVSGRPQSISDREWTFGVAATVGVTYFITSNCFLDLSYSFAKTFDRTFHVQSPFTNDFYSPLTFAGTLIGDYTANVDTHSITLSINVGF